MASWPEGIVANPMFISTFSGLALYDGASSVAVSSAGWPTNNMALFMPFRVQHPFTARLMWTIIGTSINGSIDLGIYDYRGTRLVSSGIGTPTAINSVYRVDLTDTVLNPGRYYMAISTGLAGAFQRSALNVQSLRAMGMVQQNSAHPLPATAVFVKLVSAFIPTVGITSQTTV